MSELRAELLRAQATVPTGGALTICGVAFFLKKPISPSRKLVVHTLFGRIISPDMGPICSSASKAVETRDGRSRKVKKA
jgi:hypothetical protein